MQSLSVECGLNTGCVKVYKKSPEFDPYGNFIPLHKRGPETELFRGKSAAITFFEFNKYN
jgi:hypothetical protein